MTGGLPSISSSCRQGPWDSRPVNLFSNWTLAVIVLMQHPLWREDVSVVYNCCWSSPVQRFSGPSPAGLMTKFYSHRFEIPPTWRARSPYLSTRDELFFRIRVRVTLRLSVYRRSVCLGMIQRVYRWERTYQLHPEYRDVFIGEGWYSTVAIHIPYHQITLDTSFALQWQTCILQ
jgi:hypothetical protein